MNKLQLIGNLTHDPELSETSSGVKVCRFTIAVNRNYTSSDGERKADYFPCVAWRGLAETIAKFVHKGNRIYVCGPQEQNSYEDSKGNKRTSYELVVKEIEFLTNKPAAQDEDVRAKLQPITDDTDIPF